MKRLRCWLCALAAILLCGCARFAPVLDAHYIPAAASPIIVASRLSLTQTFTPRCSGTLRQIDLPIARFSHHGPDQPLHLRVSRVRGSIPIQAQITTSVVASASIAPADVPTDIEWVSFKFREGHLSAGQRYAIWLSTEAENEYMWAGDLDLRRDGAPFGEYPDGGAFDLGSSASRSPDDPTPKSEWGYIYCDNTSVRSAGAAADLGFRVYVVPERR
jgi:hypothetical protein